MKLFEILTFYDEPQVVSFVHEGRRYIAVAIVGEENENTFLVAKTSLPEYEMYLEGEYDLRSMFTEAKEDEIFLLNVNQPFHLLPYEGEINEDHLPMEGIFHSEIGTEE